MTYLERAKASAGWVVLGGATLLLGARALAGCGSARPPSEDSGVYQSLQAGDLQSMAGDMITTLPVSATVDYVSVRKGREIPTPAVTDFTVDIARDRPDDSRAVTVSINPMSAFQLSTRFTAQGRPAQEGVDGDEAPMHDIMALLPPPGLKGGITVGATWDSEPPSDALIAAWNSDGSWATDEEQSFRIEQAWEDPVHHYLVARISSKIYQSIVETQALRDLNDARQSAGDDAMVPGRSALVGVGLHDVLFSRPGAAFSGALILRSVALFLGEQAAMDAEPAFEGVAALPDTLSVAFCATSAPADISLGIPQPAPAAFVHACVQLQVGGVQ